MDATWSRGDVGSERALLAALAEHIAAGGELPCIASPVLLDAGEVLHADLPAEGWRSHEADITYVAPPSRSAGRSCSDSPLREARWLVAGRATKPRRWRRRSGGRWVRCVSS